MGFLASVFKLIHCEYNKSRGSALWQIQSLWRKDQLGRNQQKIWYNWLVWNSADPEKQYNVFLESCIAVLNSNEVPLRKTSKKKNIIPRDRRILMRKRNKLRKKFPNNKIKEKLIDIELELQKSYISERLNCEQNATSKIKTNPKYFYSYAKRYSKTKPKVGPLMNPMQPYH